MAVAWVDGVGLVGQVGSGWGWVGCEEVELGGSGAGWMDEERGWVGMWDGGWVGWSRCV